MQIKWSGNTLHVYMQPGDDLNDAEWTYLIVEGNFPAACKVKVHSTWSYRLWRRLTDWIVRITRT